MRRYGAARYYTSILFILAFSYGTFGGQNETGPEPVYDGKTVSFWLDQLPFVDASEQGFDTEKGFPESYKDLAEAESHQKSIKETRDKAPKAIVQIGTNAIPYLLTRLMTADMRSGDNQTYEIDPATGIKREISGRVLRGQAIVACELLKKQRNVLEPQLVKIAMDGKATKIVRAAAFSALKKLSAENEKKYGDLLEK
jgi:hypothetical protein